MLAVAALPALRDPATIARLEQEEAGQTALVVTEPEDEPIRRTTSGTGSSTRGAGSSTPTSSAAPSASVAPKSGDGGANQETLDRASTVADLSALSKQYPTDGRILQKLAKAEAQTPDGLLGALATTRKVFLLDPTTVQSEELRSIVRRGAAGPPDVAALAYDLMTSSMGTSGVDLLFEISTASGASKPVKDRATAATKNAGIRAKASPALLVALDLRDSPACERKKHFERATAVGDGRSLTYLTPLTATKGCGVFGLGDCYSGCRGTGNQLSLAIKAIRDRAK